MSKYPPGYIEHGDAMAGSPTDGFHTTSDADAFALVLTALPKEAWEASIIRHGFRKEVVDGVTYLVKGDSRARLPS